MKPRSYKALVAEEKKEGFTQQVKTLSTDELPGNDVLIRVHFSSLNYKDALSATGNKGVTKSYPFTPGIDASGVVEESLDERFEAGDEVVVTSYDLGMNTPGGFGQYISVPGDWIVPLPEGLSLREAMIIGTSGLTAAMGVEKINMMGHGPDGGDLLVTGATGGVGSFAVALLAHLGYKVVAATGKVKEQSHFLKEIGSSEIIHRDSVSNVGESPLLSARWVASYDTVGGGMLDAVIRQTGHNGVVACCGNVLGHELKTSIYPFILRGISLMGVDSGIALMEDRLRIWNKLAGEWKLPVLERLEQNVTLKELPAEIEKIIQGEQTGKVVVDLLSE